MKDDSSKIDKAIKKQFLVTLIMLFALLSPMICTKTPLNRLIDNGRDCKLYAKNIQGSATKQKKFLSLTVVSCNLFFLLML